MSKYAIVDLEMCRVSKGIKKNIHNLRNELIQIGAVLVDESLKITDEFMTFVYPEFGTIDTYIENLTKISKKDIQGAPNTNEALEMFFKWLPDDTVLVSWSESDEYQIRKETEAKEIIIDRLDFYLENWIDCQKTFSEKINVEKIYKLSEALIIADIDYDDGEHNALIDAKNTAQLFIKMEKEPELKLNHYYTSIENATFNPFATLLLNLAV